MFFLLGFAVQFADILDMLLACIHAYILAQFLAPPSFQSWKKRG
jgi:hypothetical protein